MFDYQSETNLEKVTKNPIYLFYEKLDNVDQNNLNKCYKCYHCVSSSLHKVVTITPSMKSNLNSTSLVSCVRMLIDNAHNQTETDLFNHLKSCSPPLFCFYQYLKDHSPDVLITLEEQAIAGGRAPLTPAKEAEISNQLDDKQASIKTVFLKQQERAAVRLYIEIECEFMANSKFYRAHGLRTNSKNF